MARVLGLIRGVGSFWYGFIVGDDWTVAVSVLLGLVATFALIRLGLTAWWLLPLLVVLVTGLSVRRAQRS